MSKDDTSRNIGAEIRLLQQSFDAFDEAVAARLGLNRTDLRCLDVLLARGPLAAGEISTALRLSPAATTSVIDRLERAGMAVRDRDPGSRRRVLVSATEAARQAEAEIYLPVGRAGAQALRRYTAEQLATILDFLRTARRTQEEQADRIARDA